MQSLSRMMYNRLRSGEGGVKKAKSFKIGPELVSRGEKKRERHKKKQRRRKE